MKVYIVSDIHVSFPANFEHFRALLANPPGNSMYKNSSLLICGDVCEDLELLEKTLKLFKTAFENVFFVVGNHELWMVKEGNGSDNCNSRNSLDKLNDILDICEKVGVDTKVKKVGGSTWIVPLMSWHEPQFDESYNIGTQGKEIQMAGDYVYCKWPQSLQSTPQKTPICRHFLSQNEANINEVIKNRELSDEIISFSHFVPRRDLINKQWLFNPMLPLIIGCEGIDEQVRRLGSKIHVFAHTHIDADREIDGIRYVQRSFGYPRERERWKFNAANYKPFLLGDF